MSGRVERPISEGGEIRREPITSVRTMEEAALLLKAAEGFEGVEVEILKAEGVYWHDGREGGLSGHIGKELAIVRLTYPRDPNDPFWERVRQLRESSENQPPPLVI
ncbi:MAG: hypothetical protein HYV38_03490 [Candidatus Levybacteria bacterium]|nr:hypothetical protein [Candidatus Levybacteria bacterium]MBI2421121.1 hypothetical protein [Candidatus Levybacteria bacterium]MBI4096737.1 hypothetical protein [Candidatus Levybacteria bacterium]